MKIEHVGKMSAEARFLYWMRERHNVFLRRKQGKPKPWTDDVVLQSWFFTNPYRENDKTTIWFRKNVRDPLKDSGSVLIATVAFRWFNFIPTGRILLENDLLEHWDARKAIELLRKQDKIFTGAFMIPAPLGSNKVEHVCHCIDNVAGDQIGLISDIYYSKSLEESHKMLVEYPFLGDFMAYEVVTDLRYTHLLSKATDKLTWCSVGPGCARGLRRLAGLSLGKGNAEMVKKPDNWKDMLQHLLTVARKKLVDMPTIEMREIEHSLCEFDKYERARLGDGRMKRKYNGVV